jgi:hypothetical protein
MNFPYAQRSAEIRAAQQAKYTAMRASLAPRQPRARTLGETIVEGRMVKEWDIEVTKMEEAADDQRRETGKLVVVDSSAHFPPAASEAVAHWRALGRPTEYDETAAVLKRLRDEAEKNITFASLEDDRVKQFEEMKNDKKVAQHRKYAATNRAKAAKLFAEAEKVAADYKKEHP